MELVDGDKFDWIGDKTLGLDLERVPKHMKCPYCDV